MQGARYKVHDVLDQDKGEYDADVAKIWDSAERFDPKTERLFRYLQVPSPTPFPHPAMLGFSLSLQGRQNIKPNGHCAYTQHVSSHTVRPVNLFSSPEDSY